ncbi:MAG: carboxypeptidase [Proteobacteria bacterium]|nr:carboxypeptidase [Pseudomonadota bacterium]
MNFVRTSVATAAAVLLACAGASHAAGTTSRADELKQLRLQEKQSTNFYKAYFPDLETAHKAAISFHNEMIEAHYDQGYLVMQLEPAQMASLRGFGFRFERATEFIAQRNQIVDLIQQAADARQRAGGKAEDASIQSIPGYPCYPTVEETFATAQGYTVTYPTLAKWVDVGDSWQKTHNLGGYDMNVLQMTNSAKPGPKPILFITAAIHAREYTTSPVALAFADWLLTGYGTDPDATWILDNEEVHIMLQSNPDGRKMAEAGLLWRKNTDTAYCSPTSNNRGADLNRNFSFMWNSTGGQGSSGNQCNDTYRGPSPSSEPETQAMEAYMRGLWPDSRGPNLGDGAPPDTSGIHIDIHSDADMVLWPWGETEQPTGNATAFQTMGRRLAFYNGYWPSQSIGLYPTDGTSDGPSYGELGIASFTIEQGNAFFEKCSYYERNTKPTNLAALKYAARVVRAPYLLPEGPDVTSIALSAKAAGVAAGVPVTLTASITDTQFNDTNGTQPRENVVAAEAYIDTPPWVAGAVAIPLAASDGSFDSVTEQATGTLATRGLAAGKHLVFVRGKVSSGQFGPVSAAFLTIRGRTE